ncbi:putative quinol monooxygenase [Dermatophilus congolensis]|uniref:Putative monooxygenase ycnE n=1 Tax=Dermatophilus congolensis TaxID=1863 RepID=A0A239VKR0_9MICO|nr:putative quinol monooxygenase [Dermatophilus congolensis]MBO3129251.1 antibiotic biosynthesis monooxygenase [Dermatophilus congolensis]MBO3132117.1 antibiotic biosynthesis monooxygenase [Dermatophilus congolensis]MBO3133727.1 antibiotic biosynthesis monooxygenase [Dermatophilus congolensis]MBO3135958.1 antibiotic biosynthesis monooxygenase [Dermatophilus congolensis]MBO3138200.1 antibiotic biosynthesis monooxygenase [Dermatophilus congolensis]
MILINVKFFIKPEHADNWPEISRPFTEATRAEEGNLWFEWSRSIEDPNTYILLEAFTDEGAEPHVSSEHFETMKKEFPQYLTQTPQIISKQVENGQWGPMGELNIS